MGNKRKIISSIQTFMDSPKGRTYLNYIYSWGAAIVILGTLFKLTHIAGANLMLFIGMGAEVVVFFFSAFERPYELAEEDRKEERAERRAERAASGSQSIIISGNIAQGASDNNTFVGGTTTAGNIAATQTADPGLVEEMDNATKEYVEKVHSLNEAIKRISEQSESLGRNMAEMETLARNITAMNAMYEIQLRNAGNQVGNTELVNEEIKKMAAQIKELNAMYTRMLDAMTINMNRQQ
ncbi:MAG: gliding motility protein GldL [Bacteroidaceae bacterium]|nr:gliding motility protein GldL [Bacteroidaceae bacterium]